MWRWRWWRWRWQRDKREWRTQLFALANIHFGAGCDHEHQFKDNRDRLHDHQRQATLVEWLSRHGGGPKRASGRVFCGELNRNVARRKHNFGNNHYPIMARQCLGGRLLWRECRILYLS